MLEMNYTSPNSHVFKLRVYAHKNGKITGKLCQAKDYFSDKKKKNKPESFPSSYSIYKV